jgi:hypothetical protein
MMAVPPEQVKAAAHLRDLAARLAPNAIRARVGAAFAGLQALVEALPEAEARRRPAPGGWCIQEVVDHLVETQRASVEELASLLRGDRPPGPPIPAGLQSGAPLAKPWPALVAELREENRAALALLDSARSDLATTVTAPVIMVIDVKRPDGTGGPHSWVEELDWRAYALILRIHAHEHASQIKAIRAGQRV